MKKLNKEMTLFASEMHSRKGPHADRGSDHCPVRSERRCPQR